MRHRIEEQIIMMTNRLVTHVAHKTKVSAAAHLTNLEQTLKKVTATLHFPIPL